MKGIIMKRTKAMYFSNTSPATYANLKDFADRFSLLEEDIKAVMAFLVKYRNINPSQLSRLTDLTINCKNAKSDLINMIAEQNIF